MQLVDFKSKEELDSQLADDIISYLNNCITQKGDARILFSGGSTPKQLLQQLARSPLKWSHIKVGLVDDRMVPVNDLNSNTFLIKKHFFDQIKGTKPSFHPLVFLLDDPDQNIEFAHRSLRSMGVPDLVVLGMGTDGHFASLFPGDPNSQRGLDEESSINLIYTNAPSFPKNRISYTWSYLKQARKLILHITGKSKLSLLQDDIKDLPISKVINTASMTPSIYWAP